MLCVFLNKKIKINFFLCPFLFIFLCCSLMLLDMVLTHLVLLLSHLATVLTRNFRAQNACLQCSGDFLLDGSTEGIYACKAGTFLLKHFWTLTKTTK